MFVAGKSIPKIGEIRFGYASDDESRLSTHKYVGVHPYLVVSNNTYNKTSDSAKLFRLPQSGSASTIQFTLSIRRAR